MLEKLHDGGMQGRQGLHSDGCVGRIKSDTLNMLDCRLGWVYRRYYVLCKTLRWANSILWISDNLRNRLKDCGWV